MCLTQEVPRLCNQVDDRSLVYTALVMQLKIQLVFVGVPHHFHRVFRTLY